MSMVIMLYEFLHYMFHMQCCISFWQTLKFEIVLNFNILWTTKLFKRILIGCLAPAVKPRSLRIREMETSTYCIWFVRMNKFRWRYSRKTMSQPLYWNAVFMRIAVLSVVLYISQIQIIWTKYTTYHYMYSWGDCGSLNWKYNCCLYS